MLHPAEQSTFDFAPLPTAVEQASESLCSDAGLLLLAQMDKHWGVSRRLAECFSDLKRPGMLHHLPSDVFSARILGMAADYPDANDHDTLRHSLAWQWLTKGRAEPTASQPVISRIEGGCAWQDIPKMAQVITDLGVEQLEKAYPEAPTKLILDIDATDDPCHGHQQLAMFHGYTEQTQLQILSIGEPKSKAILRSCLMPGTVYPAYAAADELAPVLASLKARWPSCQCHVRADAGFGSSALMDQLDTLNLGYTMRLARNSALASDEVQQLDAQTVQDYKEITGRSEAVYGSFQYESPSWSRPRTVVYQVRPGALAPQACFLVTTDSITTREDAEAVFKMYAQRGNFEHRFDELKNDLNLDRLSCHRFRANALRMFLHLASYALVNMIRLLPGTPKTLKQAQVKTWISRVFKVAAKVRLSTRRMLFKLDHDWPGWEDFRQVMRAVTQHCNC